MRQKLMQAKERKLGFTLVEMLIVVILLGILAMVVIPQITFTSDDARLSTLQTNLSAVRSAIEVYYAQHNNSYPADGSATNFPSGVSTDEDKFVAQLTRYTDQQGNVSNSRTGDFKYGPYLKGMPMNPFVSTNNVAVDSSTTDITAKSAGSDAGAAWKFYTETGVFMAADGAHDNE